MEKKIREEILGDKADEIREGKKRGMQNVKA